MKLACVQGNVIFNDPDRNAKTCIARLEELAYQGVNLVVFPECHLTGYCVETLEDAQKIAIPADHPSLIKIQETCKELGVYCIVGYAERSGNTLYNTAQFIGPTGIVGQYRKTHLPFLGYDRFVEPGSDLPVFDTPLGKIGIAICYDLRPPEVLRVLALKGAELVVVPTNWPEGASFTPTHVVPTRANENRIFVATCNRVGFENGFGFIGSSGIYDISGYPLTTTGTDPDVIQAEIELEQAQDKHVVVIPGRYESFVFEARQPDIYSEIINPN